MNLFPPFEKWLEQAKWEPMPSGLRPMFRIAYKIALRDVADSLRADSFEGGALHVERSLARLEAEYPEQNSTGA